jgi:hypothetical protein
MCREPRCDSSGKVYDVTEFLDGTYYFWLSVDQLADVQTLKITLVCRLELRERRRLFTRVTGGSKIILKYAGKDATFVCTHIFVTFV